jgi:hypothetical protein
MAPSGLGQNTAFSGKEIAAFPSGLKAQFFVVFLRRFVSVVRKTTDASCNAMRQLRVGVQCARQSKGIGTLGALDQ